MDALPRAREPRLLGRSSLREAAAATGRGGARLAAVIRALDGLAEREKQTRSAVALAWLLVHPAGIVPILGTRRPERLREGVAALDVELSRADWYGVWAAARGEPLP